MDDPAGGQNHPVLNRRMFLGALGGAAVTAAFLQETGDANAQSQTYYYQDSFGDIAPAGADAIAMGIYPPPIPDQQPANPDAEHRRVPGSHLDDVAPDGQQPTGTFYNVGYPKYNILLIMVDQMRNPGFWVPAVDANGDSGDAQVAAALPYLTALGNQSFAFPNHWVAATICSPARACLLTGLYSQQHCVFSVLPSGTAGNAANSSSGAPALLPYNNSWTPTSGGNVGFPTIGNVLSQNLSLGHNGTTFIAYDTAWIGKWHLSCLSGVADGSPGQDGPSDYGFTSAFSLPATNTHTNYPEAIYPSPNGLTNEGVGGDFWDSTATAQDVPVYTHPSPVISGNGYTVPSVVQLNDAAIADAFLNKWLPNANANLTGSSETQLLKPWFCAVSFVNPHDITDFPYPFGLAGTSGFGNPTLGYEATRGFQPAPVPYPQNNYSGNACVGTSCTDGSDIMVAANFSAPYTQGLPPGGGTSLPWNWEDLTQASLQYANNGKPGLQQYFLGFRDNICGSIPKPAYNTTTGVWTNAGGWETFLNYYIWLQSCVDYQIGRVLGTVAGVTNNGLAQSPFASNTIVIFTSDHGDYAGSHGLHSKGGALYEEAINVPLYISFPSQRNNSSSQMINLPYVCSSVDILPAIYSLALGNSLWRQNPNDMIYHLNNRESIEDAIYAYNSSYLFLQQRRISSIPLYNPPCTSGCANWQSYQPFVLSTADDYALAPLGMNSNYQPSHAIAFRTVDITDPTFLAAPFAGKLRYGGGKLGLYQFWDTCGSGLTAPIYPTNTGNSQYEFYNYSPHPAGSLSANPQEVGNQFFNSLGTKTLEAGLYYNDYMNTGTVYGINVQSELYVLAPGSGTPRAQVAAAIQVAFANYITFLKCAGDLTGTDGTPCTQTPACADYQG